MPRKTAPHKAIRSVRRATSSSPARGLGCGTARASTSIGCATACACCCSSATPTPWSPACSATPEPATRRPRAGSPTSSSTRCSRTPPREGPGRCDPTQLGGATAPSPATTTPPGSRLERSVETALEPRPTACPALGRRVRRREGRGPRAAMGRDNPWRPRPRGRGGPLRPASPGADHRLPRLARADGRGPDALLVRAHLPPWPRDARPVRRAQPRKALAAVRAFEDLPAGPGGARSPALLSTSRRASGA